MVDSHSAWRAEPLTWGPESGQGSRLFEVFLEPTCPFSAKAFGKLDETLAAAGAGNVTLRIWLHSQPWHLFSGVIVRCVLAASTLAEGKDAAKKVLAAVAAHRDRFEPADHCSGPLLALSPNDVIARVEEYSGLALARAWALPGLDREVKRHTRYARQNGIHVSPTFMIDGLVQNDMSSGDAVSAWVSRLSAD